MPSDCDWCDRSTLTLVILKIESQKINQVHLLRFWHSISGIEREIETYCIFIKDNIASQKELWQKTTSHSGSLNKMETISIRCYGEVWSLNRSWKSQVFLRTTQAQ